MSLFVHYNLLSYNKHICSLLIIDCDCYAKYSNRESFIRFINQRGSYNACIAQTSEKRNRPAHTKLPIKLGSKLDFLIRGEQAFRETQDIFGAFIIKGQLVYMPCFMTHDAMSLHVTQLKSTKHVDWYFYVNQTETNREGVALKFTGTKINWIYRQQAFTDDEDDQTSTRNLKEQQSISYVEKRKMTSDNNDSVPQKRQRMNIDANSIKAALDITPEPEMSYLVEPILADSDKLSKTNYLTDVTDERHWINLLNSSKRFNNRYVTKDEYIFIFKKILQIEQATPNSMNSWKNKKILSGVTVIREFIKSHERAKQNKALSGNAKLVQGFESGSLYTILSKKNVLNQGGNSSGSSGYAFQKTSPNVATSLNTSLTPSYNATSNNGKIYTNSQYYIPLNEGKCTSLPFLLPYVTRRTNEAVQNSKTAMHFSEDGLGLICPLNTKDFKETGERITLADGVIMTEETNEDELYWFLKKHLTKPSANETSILFYNVSINGILTDIHLSDSLETLINVKNRFPHVTTKYFDEHILFSTRECIPIKYFDDYDNFFSAAEIEHFHLQNKIQDGDFVSLAIKQISVHGLITNKPSKTTTSNTTLFHSISNKPSPLVLSLMSNSLGLTVYFDLGKHEKNIITHSNRLPELDDHSHQLSRNWNNAYSSLDTNFNLTEQKAFVHSAMRSYNKSAALEKLTKSLYNNNEFLYYHYKSKNIQKNTPFQCVFDKSPEMVTALKRYTEITFDSSRELENVWNMKLWCAFGNPHGFCGLDGLVLDSDTSAMLANKVVYQACFTVDFIFLNIRKAQSVEVKRVTNSHLTQSNLVCILLSEYEACTKNSNHCEIKWGKYGNMYQYEVYFLPKKMYSEITIDYARNGKVLGLTIKGSRKTGVGIGTKFGNSFGQKNIVSQLLDMKNPQYKAICFTKSGKAVYPQLIYSDVSILGRQASGQLKAMFLNDELALNPYTGCFTAYIDVCIHNLHTFTNERVFTIKLDTLTGLNGFCANGLPNTAHTMRIGKEIYPKVKQVIGFHGFNVSLL